MILRYVEKDPWSNIENTKHTKGRSTHQGKEQLNETSDSNNIENNKLSKFLF
jgi:hypothetical protein